ncbi:MAG: OmpA family protein [Deltaproteobacteria bacterium]|nr:OmpA family protein [Deltaproteobacteria bacterium]
MVALAYAGCAATVVLHENEPVTVAARRPAPPPPPPAEPPPPPPVVQVEQNRIRVDEKIQFEFNSSVISGVSHGLLDQIAQVINEHPEVGAIRVEGHTDNVGAATYNRRLSQKRAEAVVAYLVSKGVSADRLRSQGFGLDRPVAPNADEAGRAQNRRVEFNFVNPPAEGQAPQAQAGGAQ